MGIQDALTRIVTQREVPEGSDRRAVGPSFADLIAAHKNRNTDDGKRKYDAAVAQFCREHGLMDDVYWAADGVSGVAVTLRRQPFRRLGYRTARLHRVSDHATRNAPEIAGAIGDWELLAGRAQMLRGANSNLCMQWILAGIAYLLSSVVAAHQGKLSKEETRKILASQRRPLRDVNAYYLINATRGAYVDYFSGMMLGVVFNAALAIGVFVLIRGPLHWLWEVEISDTSQAFAFGCIVAGAIGSIFSVLLRMSSGRFRTDYEAGRSRLWLIGSFRPFIGAVSGLALYFAVKGDFVSLHQNDESFVALAFLAFLAGFSERFARDTFAAAEAAVVPVSTEPPSVGATVDGTNGGSRNEVDEEATSERGDATGTTGGAPDDAAKPVKRGSRVR
jgi:hypothetical protein